MMLPRRQTAACGSLTRDNRMNAVDRDPDDDGRDSVDHLIVSLRAYVTRAPTKAKKSKGEEKRDQRPAGAKQFPPRIPPDGGHPSLFNLNVKTNMPIETNGVVITIT